jgi:CheY-like chemotaxis protein
MATTPTNAATPAAGRNPSGLCVLVVEDDEADAYLISRALTDQPSVGQVIRARDGVEALDLIESGETRPNLAFIDLHMPRKNGVNLLAAFASHPRAGFPMVVLTSSTAPDDAIRSRLRGAIRVVTKPDTVPELESMLKSAIEAVCPRGASRGPAPAPQARAAPARLRPFPGISAAAIDER